MDSNQYDELRVMRNSDQNSMANVTYVDYKDLQMPANTPQELLIQLQNTNWRIQFQALDGLRGLLKYDWPKYDLIRSEVIPIALDLIISLRSNVSKNTLTFLGESYLFENEKSQEGIDSLVPVLLQKAISDKQFIRKEAQFCLSNMTNKAVGESLVHALKAECSNRNGYVAETAFEHLANTLDRIPDDLKIEICFELFDSKRNLIRNKIISIMKTIQSTPGFISMLEYIENEKKSRIMLAMQEKKQRAGFRDFLKRKAPRQHRDDTEIFELVQ